MSIKALTEQSLIRPALQLLAARGVFAWRNNSGGMKAGSAGKGFIRFGGAPGASDIIGVLPGGRFIAVELKRPGNVPTPKQQAFLAAVEAQGGAALCVHSLTELEKALAELLPAKAPPRRPAPCPTGLPGDRRQ